MITRAEIENLSADEKLQLIHAAWKSFLANPESLPITEQEKKQVRQRSRAHHLKPNSSLSEQQFAARLEKRLGRRA